MHKFLALFAILASPALAQQPNGTINAPIYATGYISQVGGTNVTTKIPPQPNHPTNLNIYTTGAISGTWSIQLPNPAFEGQMLSFNCGAAANAIAITSSDGSSIDSNLPTSCITNGGFVTQFDLRSNIWRSLGSGYSANFRPFTGVTSQWPWQLNADGTWTAKAPVPGALLGNFSGVDPTGAADSAAAANSAATSVAGDVLYVGAGTYKTTAPIYLPSGTSVVCSQGATFKPTTGFSVFATQNYNRNILVDTTPTNSANQTDHDISVSGCTFDFSSVSVASGGPTGDVAAAFSAYLARRVRFTGNYVVGGSTQAGAAAMMRCIASDVCEFTHNVGSRVGVGFDSWQGSTNVTAKSNKVAVVSNPSAWGNLYCFGFNGVGTYVYNQEASSGFNISDNFCETNGNAAGIQFDALGPGSYVSNGVVENNVITAASGTVNYGIYGRGSIKNVKVSGNKLNGQDSYPVHLDGYYTSGGPFTCTGCLTTTNGSSSVVVAKTGLDYSNVAVGNFVYFNSASAVGGLTLATGQYPVIAVNPGVSITINAGSNASSSTSGGGSVSFNIFWGTVSYSQVVNNSFYNVSNVGSSLIYASGPGNTIGGNSAIAGTYGAFVYADSLFSTQAQTPVPMLFGNYAPAGGGISGASGDGVNAYNSSTVPIILDNAGLKDRANTWAAAQTFSAAPIFTTLTGYVKGNGASAATASATVPTTDLSGTLQAAQEPAHTGDVTNSAGSLALTLATVNSNVGTFGSATQVPQITVNAKGLATAVANVTVTPAVGSITGLGTGVATALGNATNASGGLLAYGSNVGLHAGISEAAFRVSQLNLNATGDTAVTITMPQGSTRWVLFAVRLSNSTGNLPNGTGTLGLYTGAGRTGTTLVTQQTLNSVITSQSDATAGNAGTTTNAVDATQSFTATTIYLNVQTAQGATAAVDVALVLRFF